MGKRLNIELGQRGVNSGQKFSSRFLELPGLSVLHFYVFSDFPSSEVKYTGLEFRGKGSGGFSKSPPRQNSKGILGNDLRTVETTGIEPATPALQRQCSPN